MSNHPPPGTQAANPSPFDSISDLLVPRDQCVHSGCRCAGWMNVSPDNHVLQVGFHFLSLEHGCSHFYRTRQRPSEPNELCSGCGHRWLGHTIRPITATDHRFFHSQKGGCARTSCGGYLSVRGLTFVSWYLVLSVLQTAVSLLWIGTSQTPVSAALRTLNTYTKMHPRECFSFSSLSSLCKRVAHKVCI